MNCEHLELVLLDESLPRPAGFDAHLATCPKCRAVAAAHRNALRLRGLSPERARRRPLAEVKRRAGVVAGLVLALGGGVGWYQLERSEPVPAPSPVVVALPVEQPSMPVVAEAPPDDPLLALAALRAYVAADTAREPREDALARKVFGQLPKWTAPRRTHPLRSLGGAASPVVYTSEDSP